mmetsp:Transcript_9849/g.36727  ORF Transcript_9849/g.36727 Transcript_9849/m.36727 type:complete len:259 (+) Transcript_9849:97-873(+)
MPKLPSFTTNDSSAADSHSKAFTISEMGDIVSQVPLIPHDSNRFACYSHTQQTSSEKLLNDPIPEKKYHSLYYLGFKKRDAMRDILHWIKEVTPEEKRPNKVFFMIPTLAAGRDNVPLALQFERQKHKLAFVELIQDNKDIFWKRPVERIKDIVGKLTQNIPRGYGKHGNSGSSHHGNGRRSSHFNKGELSGAFGGGGRFRKSGKNGGGNDHSHFNNKQKSGNNGKSGGKKDRKRKRDHSDSDRQGDRKRHRTSQKSD